MRYSEMVEYVYQAMSGLDDKASDQAVRQAASKYVGDFFLEQGFIRHVHKDEDNGDLQARVAVAEGSQKGL